MSVSSSADADSADSPASHLQNMNSLRRGSDGSPQKPAAAAAAEAVAKGEAQIYHYPFGQLRTVAAFDITSGNVPEEIATTGSGSFVLLIFVLSALHPRHHAAVAKRCAEVTCVTTRLHRMQFYNSATCMSSHPPSEHLHLHACNLQYSPPPTRTPAVVSPSVRAKTTSSKLLSVSC